MISASVQAANIEWTIANIDGSQGVGDLGVSNSGTLVEASNFGQAGGGTLLINTVAFNNVTFPTALSNLTGLTYNTQQAVTGTSTGGSIDTLSSTIAFQTGVDPQNGTLTGLEVGKPYIVQAYLQHGALDRTLTLTGGANSTTLSTRNPGQIATGIFFADANAQAISFDASTGSQLLNGYQLREAPEVYNTALFVNFDEAVGSLNATLPDGYRTLTGTGPGGSASGTANFASPLATDGDIGVTVNSGFFRNTNDANYGNVTSLDPSGNSWVGYNAVMNSGALVNSTDQEVTVEITDLMPGAYNIKFFLHSIWNHDSSDTAGAWNISGDAMEEDVLTSLGYDDPSGGFPVDGFDGIESITLPFTVGSGDLTTSFTFTPSELSTNNQLWINGFELTPVPEPASLTTWALIAAVCMGLRRVRRNG